AYAGTEWSLLHPADTYRFGDADDREWETDLAGFGRTFPHPFGPEDGRYFTTLLTTSPSGDELTLDFARTLMEREELGQDEVTDYLSVSFSSTDYVGHLFGPSSLETEDNLLRLDRVLADLLTHVDTLVGLENTLVVLSADHGTPEVPGYLRELGIPAGYVEPDTWDRAPAVGALKRRFGFAEELIETYSHPYVYLNREIIQELGLDQGEVERALAAELLRFPGVGLAVSSTSLREGNLPDTPLLRSVLHNFNPSRSGDVYVIFEPHWFINDFDGLTVAATHGSPWRYDTFVPIMFAGWRVPARHVSRRVFTVDLAPTLSRILGIKPPSGAAGVPLVEVVGEGGGH
ncbi:MAG: alkaline phosphatase family protein, partial [Longimicrobiales bacterium]